MIRRFGDVPASGRRYQTRAGVYAVLPKGRDILVTFFSGNEPEFQLPGGGVDPGESPLAALHREVFEETGWKIASPRRIGAFRRFTFMPEYDLWAEKLCTIFVAQPIFPLGDPIEPEHTAVWMPGEIAADQLGNAGDRHFVRGLYF